jgi:two-component system sensor histidine kinase DesK
MDVDPARARAEVEQIHDLSRQALAEVRTTVGGLRVARLVDEVEAARTVLGDAGITADLPGDLDVVDPRHRIVLAWALREAVTNVVRHSGATRCSVTLGPDRLRVEDDGSGVHGREGNGIRGLRERVTAAGGTLTLRPGETGGTVLEVRL